MDPESMQEVRLYAPQAFRRQERAVTPEDYASIAGRHPQVQRAQASLRWTGSWHTVFVTIDRSGGDGRWTMRFQSTNCSIFSSPSAWPGTTWRSTARNIVPLEVALAVCVKAGYFQADVRRGLLERLGSRDLPGRPARVLPPG